MTFDQNYNCKQNFDVFSLRGSVSFILDFQIVGSLQSQLRETTNKTLISRATNSLNNLTTALVHTVKKQLLTQIFKYKTSLKSVTFGEANGHESMYCPFKQNFHYS